MSAGQASGQNADISPSFSASTLFSISPTGCLYTLQTCDVACYLLSQVSVSRIVLATACYSVSHTVLAFTFANPAASFYKSDAPFKSVSVSQTFSTFIQRVRRCLSVYITDSVCRCCNLHLCLTLVHRVDKSLGVHITHYHGKKVVSVNGC